MPIARKAKTHQRRGGVRADGQRIRRTGVAVQSRPRGATLQCFYRQGPTRRRPCFPEPDPERWHRARPDARGPADHVLRRYHRAGRASRQARQPCRSRRPNPPGGVRRRWKITCAHWRGTAASAYVDAVSGQLILTEKQRAFTSLNQLANAQRRYASKQATSARWTPTRRAPTPSRPGATCTLPNRATAPTSTRLLQLLGRPGAPLPRTVNHLDVRGRPPDLTALLANASGPPTGHRGGAQHPATPLAPTPGSRGSIVIRTRRSAWTFQQSLVGHNPIDPTPNFNTVNLSVSLPLPLWNSLRGEYLTAVSTAAQAEQSLRSTELKVEVDLRGSYARYQTASLRLTQYQNGALELASKVLQAQLFKLQGRQRHVARRAASTTGPTRMCTSPTLTR